MLTALLLIPIVGAIILAPMNETTPAQISSVKRVALMTTVIAFIVSMVMWSSFDSSSSMTIQY